MLGPMLASIAPLPSPPQRGWESRADPHITRGEGLVGTDMAPHPPMTHGKSLSFRTVLMRKPAQRHSRRGMTSTPACKRALFWCAIELQQRLNAPFKGSPTQ
jgi:hypothetical protein